MAATAVATWSSSRDLLDLAHRDWRTPPVFARSRPTGSRAMPPSRCVLAEAWRRPADALGLWRFADRLQTSAATNLITNGIAATPSGGRVAIARADGMSPSPSPTLAAS